MEAIKVIGVKYSYCHQCNLPTLILEIQVKGWQATINICRNCLEELIRKLDSEAFKLVEIDKNTYKEA